MLIVAVLAASLVPFPTAEATGTTVTASNFRWSPSEVTVVVGDTVLFANGEGTHSWVQDGSNATCALPCSKTFSTLGVVAYHCGVHPTTMRGNVTVVAPTTLAIATPTSGASVSGTVNVSGTANNSMSNVTTVRLNVDGGASLFATHTTGTGVDWWYELDTLALANGAHTVSVTAFAATGASATADVTFTVANPATVDLVALSMGSTAPLTGNPAIAVNVRNAGNAASGAYHVKFEYLANGEWRLIGEAAAPALAAGSTHAVQVTWSSGVHVGRFDVRATVDDLAEVAESSESNNGATGEASWYTSLVAGMDPLG